MHQARDPLSPAQQSDVRALHVMVLSSQHATDLVPLLLC